MKARRYTFADRLADALLLSILHGMTTGLRTPRRVAASRHRSFPAQFKSRKEWLAWCEEDRRAEAREQLEDVWTQEFSGAAARAA